MAYMHIMETLIDVCQIPMVSDVLIDLNCAFEIVCNDWLELTASSYDNETGITFHKSRDFSPAFDTSKGRSTPSSSSYLVKSFSSQVIIWKEDFTQAGN